MFETKKPTIDDITSSLKADLTASTGEEVVEGSLADIILKVVATQLYSSSYGNYDFDLDNFLLELGILVGLERKMNTNSVGYVSFPLLNDDTTPVILANTLIKIKGLLYKVAVDSAYQDTTYIPVGNVDYFDDILTIDLGETIHYLALNDKISIIDSADTKIIGEWEVLDIIDINKFSIKIAGLGTGTIVDPQTIKIKIKHIYCEVISVEVGNKTNAPKGYLAKLITAIPNVSIDGYTSKFGVIGGVEKELTKIYHERLGRFLAKPISSFNVNEIDKEFDKIEYVGEWAYANNQPTTNKTTIIFAVNEPSSFIPSPEQIAEVEAMIRKIQPINLAPEMVVITGVVQTNVSFTLKDSNLQPNSPAMKNSIKSQLDEFINSLKIGQDVLIEDVKSLLNNLIDTSGNPLKFYEIISPTDTIIIDFDKKAKLIDVIYA